MTIINSSFLKPRHKAAGARLLLVLGLLWTALYLAWQSLSAVNFLYPVWYQVLDIQGHIERYAPQNYYRDGFETTGSAQRQALFAEIVRAINRGGEGLREITYRTAAGEEIALLREPEAVHLDSVARLIDRLRVVSYLLLGVLALGLVALWRLRALPPPPLRIMGWSLAATALATVAILLYGPEEVFELAHELVFPPGEQWFFYYQESLMTTLMKAPDLFAALAVLLVAVWLAWFALLLYGSRRLLARRAG